MLNEVGDINFRPDRIIQVQTHSTLVASLLHMCGPYILYISNARQHDEGMKILLIYI